MTDADIALVQRLADAAAAEIRPYFRNLAAVDTKADASPVTAADRAAEAAIRAILAAERPGDGIIGEEYGEDRPDAGRVWVIDPIDGTRSFIAGRPTFGTLVALLEDGVPVIGVLDQCVTGDRWVGAAGRSTTLGGVPATTRRCPALAGAHVGTTSPYLFDDPAPFQRVRVAARDVLYGGDCYNYGLVASGHLDLVVESGLKVYDWAALVPIVRGAGGTMTDWHGEPLRRGSDGRVIASGDRALLPQVISTLSP